ncbi:hypothetical protein A1O7_03371 [Cladophialophora yegresii CBS 114405]|uniref:Uncharacterized protein n=1 Tax=Cladophialophora yegresii CBS 114405 TaxID=1182544 RepID=W9W4Q4_9EURO|nr:uncharacterized protein A1O7_03371 [Cladophialophora yegresii CBS 114405]EXJ62928.1 hypothetical protein A1O7_03371 [Cladophialophora yegresii CBS 114405]
MASQHSETTDHLRAVIVLSRTSYAQNRDEQEANAEHNKGTYEFIIRNVHRKLTHHKCASATSGGHASDPSPAAPPTSSPSSGAETQQLPVPHPCVAASEFVNVNLSHIRLESNIENLANRGHEELLNLRSTLDAYEAEPNAPKAHVILAIYEKRGLGFNMMGIKDFFSRYKRLTITLVVFEEVRGRIDYTFRCYHMHKLLRSTDAPHLDKYSDLLEDMCLLALERKNDTDTLAELVARLGAPPPSDPWQIARDQEREDVAQWWRDFRYLVQNEPRNQSIYNETRW